MQCMISCKAGERARAGINGPSPVTKKRLPIQPPGASKYIQQGQSVNVNITINVDRKPKQWLRRPGVIQMPPPYFMSPFIFPERKSPPECAKGGCVRYGPFYYPKKYIKDNDFKQNTLKKKQNNQSYLALPFQFTPPKIRQTRDSRLPGYKQAWYGQHGDALLG